MKKISFKKLARFLPLNLFIAVFLFDLFTLITQLLIKELMVIREMVLVLGFVLLLPVFLKIKWFEEKDALKKIKIMLICMVGVYIALQFFPDIERRSTDYFILRTSIGTLLVSTILSLFAVSLSLLILLLIRDLIFIRRKRTTQRNFWLLVAFMAIGMGYAEYVFLLSKNSSNSMNDLLQHDWIGIVFLVVFIMFVVLNSFRNTWIAYLSKKQKVTCLFFSILLAIGPIFLHNQVSANAIRYSLAFDLFINQFVLLLGIYWSIAAMVILFHLPTAGIVDRKMKEIRSLHALSRALSSEFDFNKLVLKITELSIEVTEASATYLQILDVATDELSLVSSKNLTAKEIEWLNEHPKDSSGNWVVENRQALWVNDVAKDSRLQYLRQWKRRVESVIAVPLISYDKILGVLCALKIREYGFIPEDLDLLQAFADHATIALENSRLVKESIEKERLEQELKVAHDAQMKLLPKTMPELKGLDIDAICVTANDVGGDYYDLFIFDDHSIGIVIGDVSGKGAEAAFYMAEVKGIIKSLSQVYRSPKEVLSRANEILFDTFDRKTFISLAYAIIDNNTKELVFSRAGHCPLLLYQNTNGGVKFIEPRGIGLGLTRGAKFSQITEEKRLPLFSGDVLLFFTDGVVEARNWELHEFDEENLKSTFEDLIQFNSTEIKNRLVNEVRAFVGTAKTHDDLTMVVVKIA